MNAFRDDPEGRELNCKKIYSDPDMFFMIWRNAMIEEVTRSKMQRKGTKKKKPKNQRKQVKLGKIVTNAQMIIDREAAAGNLTMMRQKSGKLDRSASKDSPAVASGDAAVQGGRKSRGISIVASTATPWASGDHQGLEVVMLGTSYI